MRKIIHIQIMLFCLLSCFNMGAQTIHPDEYWKDVDFSDTIWLSTEELNDKIVDFLYRYSCCDEDLFDSLSISGVGIVLEKAKVNMRLYESIIEFLLNGYTSMGKFQVVDYLLSYPMLFEGEISIEEGFRLDSITEPYQKVKVGAKAPDFVGVTIDGKPYSIYESSAKRIILVFWSTDCEYCHDFLRNIRKNLDLKFEYELVTFVLAENQEEVAASIKKMRLHGYHFYDELRWESKSFLDYHVISTPTVFVLDQNKDIVCKPYDWNELKQWIRLKK